MSVLGEIVRAALAIIFGLILVYICVKVICSAYFSVREEFLVRLVKKFERGERNAKK
jgi:hypothetical protein